ncbi:MAG: anti-sigma factor C-terminal domain-containing protein, partial [Bacillaceae bacterium]
TSSDWSMFEKLPEGTVAEAYITLKEYHGTDELLKKLEKAKIDPVWFAVYTGDEFKYDNHANDIVGYPYQTLRFEEDWVTEKETDGGSVRTAPNIEAYGSEELRDKQFLKALRLLQEHKQVLDGMYMPIKIDSKVKYVEKNGVKIYGLVVTGPTKELLKLKDVDWIQSLQVSDTALWNYKNS